MKVLLDECVTKKLKPYMGFCEVCTVNEMGWAGIKNGKLLNLCLQNDFDVLLTIDKNLMFQQNISKSGLTIVVFNSSSSKIEALGEYIPSFQNQLKSFEKNKAYLIDK